MQSGENEHERVGEVDTISVPRTRLTETIQMLQEMFPKLNTAIIDRAVLTSKGDTKLATEKLLQISSKFS